MRQHLPKNGYLCRMTADTAADVAAAADDERSAAGSLAAADPAPMTGPEAAAPAAAARLMQRCVASGTSGSARLPVVTKSGDAS